MQLRLSFAGLSPIHQLLGVAHWHASGLVFIIGDSPTDKESISRSVPSTLSFTRDPQTDSNITPFDQI
jgi:hypothetical protein